MDGSNGTQISLLNPSELVPNASWSAEDLDFLVKNRMSMSLSDIAKHLKKTRNAIAGKSHRLGLRVPKSTANKLTSIGVKRLHKAGVFANRVKIVRKSENNDWNPLTTTFKRGEKAVPKYMIEPPVSILDGVGVKMWMLEAHHCRWVVGEPSDLTCCGQNRHPNSPYCQDHHTISYKPVPSRVR